MEMKKENFRSSPDTVLQDFLRNTESETTESSSKSSTYSEFEILPYSKPVSKCSELMQLIFKDTLKRRLRINTRDEHGLNPVTETDFSYFKPQWKNFSLSELQTATNNFCKENLIGTGGYAQVYKGCLGTGQRVAVKRLTTTKSLLRERIEDFLSELGIMAHINHPNTATLIGYGMEGGLYLVLELSPNGSLASLLLSSKKKVVKWSIRYQIGMGIARGLLYLHEGCQRRIIHRDIKAANILLTDDYQPQICDFGLAKWLPERWTHLNVSKFQGTFGYLAPEFILHGIVDEKTDVYAYGVLLLELITGRRALDYTQQSLVTWAKLFMMKDGIMELVDPLLTEYNPIEIKLVILAAFLCVHESAIQRPRISQVLLLLRGSFCSKEMVKSRKISYCIKYYQQLFSVEGCNTRKQQPQQRSPLELL